MDCPGHEETPPNDWSPIFQFDVERLRLRNAQSGRQCALTRNEALLLEALVSGVCSKSDLIDEVWTRHGTVVTENSYYQLVSLLRKSFASIDLDGTVVTVPRKGLSLAGVCEQELDIDDETETKTDTDRLSSLHGRTRAIDDPATAFDVGRMPPITHGSESVFVRKHDIPHSPASAAGVARQHKPAARPFSFGASLLRVAREFASRPATMTGLTILGMGVVLTAVFAAGAIVSDSSPLALWGARGLSTRCGEHAFVSGDVLVHYSCMPAATALRVWQDIESRVVIPPEQRAYVFINQYRNRFAVLACSAHPQLASTRCLTVTESL